MLIFTISVIQNFKVRNLTLRLLKSYYSSQWYLAIIDNLLLGYSIEKIDNNRVLLTGIKLEVEKDRFTFLIKSYETALSLFEQGFNFSIDENSLLIKKEDLTLEIKTAEDFYILDEIFYNEVYHIEPIEENLIMIDIGSNKAYSVLYSALNGKLTKVIGYEPVNLTYKEAVSNISLNPTLEAKITLHNYGLSDAKGQKEFFVNEKTLGQSSSILIPFDQINTERVWCRMENADLEIKSIMNEHEDYNIFIKMDCEGGEIDILNSLSNTLKENRIKYLVLEWHDNYQTIIDLLTTCGFTISLSRDKNHIGLIRAFKLS